MPGIASKMQDIKREAAVANLADRLCRGFLEPALSIQDFRVRYREVNRAAGVAVGWTIAQDDPGLWGHLVEAVRAQMAAHPEMMAAFEKRVGEIVQTLGTAG